MLDLLSIHDFHSTTVPLACMLQTQRIYNDFTSSHAQSASYSIVCRLSSARQHCKTADDTAWAGFYFTTGIIKIRFS